MGGRNLLWYLAALALLVGLGSSRLSAAEKPACGSSMAIGSSSSATRWPSGCNTSATLKPCSTAVAVWENNVYAPSPEPPYNAVEEYTTSGTLTNSALISNPPSYDIAVYGNDLFMPNGNSIAEYNATTGALINASFITGLSDVTGLIVVATPEPATWIPARDGRERGCSACRRKKLGRVSLTGAAPWLIGKQAAAPRIHWPAHRNPDCPRNADRPPGVPVPIPLQLAFVWV